MSRWWKPLALSAGILANLGGYVASANAQFPPPGSGPYPPTEMGPPPGMPFGPPGMSAGAPPGAFGGPPPVEMNSPEFPNPAKPSGEPVSPFSVREGGMPNAFNECNPKVPEQRYLSSDSLTFRAEYLNWRVRSGPLNVPIVTTTSAFNDATSNGQLGNPNTSILQDAGPGAIDYKSMSGVRLSVGAGIGYLPPIEFTGFYLNRNTNLFSGGSLANPTQALSIPYLNVQPGTFVNQALPIEIPASAGGLGGTISVSSQFRFWGAEANTFFQLPDEEGVPLKLSLLTGFRYLRLSESLDIKTQSAGDATGVNFNGTNFAAGSFSTITLDNFGTRNVFNGGQIGLRGTYCIWGWSLNADLKLAAGVTTERLNVSGTSTLVPTGSTTPTLTSPGGIFALPSNSGTFSANTFAIVPEANLSLSYQLNDYVRFFGGYNYLYWSRVSRPGDAISNSIDARQIPTSGSFVSGASYNGPLPPSIVQRSFYAQGLFIGLEIGF